MLPCVWVSKLLFTPSEVSLGRADLLDEGTRPWYSRPFAGAAYQYSLLHSPFSSNSTPSSRQVQLLVAHEGPCTVLPHLLFSVPQLKWPFSFRKPFLVSLGSLPPWYTPCVVFGPSLVATTLWLFISLCVEPLGDNYSLLMFLDQNTENSFLIFGE